MVLGLVGLIAMTLLGFSHGGHAQHAHGPHASHGHAHAQGAHHGHNGHGAHHGQHDSSATSKLLSIISPRVLFSLALGFGATGLVAAGFIPFTFAVLVAIVGAIALERLVVQPYWNLLLRFASAPADTLDSLVRAKARAVMPFDKDGSGLVILELDGQVRQVLGTLLPEQRHLEVLLGDALRVEAVDRHGNCTVSKLL
jgi:hypothetical protein